MRADHLLGKIGHHEIRHSSRVTYHKDEQYRTADLFEISASIELTEDEVRNYDIEGVSTKLFYFVDEMIANAKKGIFAELERLTAFSGTTMDAKGKPFSYDMYLDMIESMPIQFDSDGQPRLPTIVGDPKLASIIASRKPSPEHEQRLRDIIDKKRKDYLDTKRSRRLSSLSY